MINFVNHFGTQLLSLFIRFAKVANHEKLINTNGFSMLLLFRDLTNPRYFGPHFSLFFKLYAKKVDWGTPSQSSGRQHGTQNRPSGVKTSLDYNTRNSLWPPRETLAFKRPPEAPKGPILNDSVCILVPLWRSPFFRPDFLMLLGRPLVRFWCPFGIVLVTTGSLLQDSQ